MGTPASKPRPAGKGKGRQMNYCPPPRVRYPVVFKQKSSGFGFCQSIIGICFSVFNVQINRTTLVRHFATLNSSDNDDSNNIEIYAPSEQNVKIVSSGSWYSLSPDHLDIFIYDSQSKTMYIGGLSNLELSSFPIDSNPSNVFWSPKDNRLVVEAPSGVIKLINYLDSQLIDLGTGSNVIWSPDGEKIALISGEYYKDELMALQLWSKDGVADDSLNVENAVIVDFSWGANSSDFAYVATYKEGKNYNSTMYLDGYILDKPSQIGSVAMLPDGNIAYGANYYDTLIDVDNNYKETSLPSPYYSLQSIASDLVLLSSYSEEFFLVDKDGLHEFLFGSDYWSLKWHFVNSDLWLFSGEEAYAPLLDEKKTFDISQNSTVIAWTPNGYYPNIMLLPEYTAPIVGSILVCTWKPENDKEIFLRQCGCGEFECNCKDDYRGFWKEDRIWSRGRPGVEQYFTQLGGSCSDQ
ncbi:MAG: hypothetical protein IPG44_09425 [Anaerolineales bacterium]|nr:hypothetical protein [Anaerolineales bacterium]